MLVDKWIEIYLKIIEELILKMLKSLKKWYMWKFLSAQTYNFDLDCFRTSLLRKTVGGGVLATLIVIQQLTYW